MLKSEKSSKTGSHLLVKKTVTSVALGHKNPDPGDNACD